jgi:hypothetical protein
LRNNQDRIKEGTMDTQDPVQGTTPPATSLVPASGASSVTQATAPVTHVIQTHKSAGEVDACRLDAQGLQELENRIIEGLTAEERAHFSITVERRDSKLMAPNVAALLAYPQLPNRLGKTTLTLALPHRKIEVCFHRMWADVTVSGASQEWVLGRYGRIMDCLRTYRPWYFFAYYVQNRPLIFLPLNVLTIFFLSGWGNSLAHQSRKSLNLLWTGAFDLTVVAWLGLMVLMTIIVIFAPVARIVLRPGHRLFTEQRIVTWAIIINAIAAVLVLLR